MPNMPLAPSPPMQRLRSWIMARVAPEDAEPQAVTVVLFGVTGFLLGLGVLFADRAFVASPAAYEHSGQFRLWVFLIGIQTGLWAAALVPLAIILRDLWAHWERNRREVIATSAVFAVLVVVFILGASVVRSFENPMHYFHVKIVVLSLVGAAVALAGVVGISLVHAALKDEFDRGQLGEKQLSTFLRLQEQLRRLLAVDGAIIGAAILSSGALRNALLAYYEKRDPAFSFPREYVLIYGAFFSALLALVYAPTHARLRQAGRRLRDAFAPLGPPTDESWAAAYDKRRKLEELLELGVTTTGSFRTGVAILAPLSSSILGLALGASS